MKTLYLILIPFLIISCSSENESKTNKIVLIEKKVIELETNEEEIRKQEIASIGIWINEEYVNDILEFKSL